MKLESYILNDFFKTLNAINANYCVMNNYENMPETIPSDVDFAVDLETYNKLDSLIIKLSQKHNISITQKIWHGYNKCAYILSPLDIDDYFWLQLDFFVDFSGRGFPNLLPSKIMLLGKIKFKNFYIPKPNVEVPFIIQRRIFKGDIEEKHISTLVKLYNKDIKSVKNSLINIFGENEGKLLIDFIESKNIENFKKNYPIYRKKLERISLKNTPLIYRLKYTIWQFIRAIYRFYYPTGLSIAFIGKNTLTKREFIEEFNKKISGSFHGSKFFLPKSIKDYILNMIFKDYWLKVTKRKTLWNLDNQKINFKRWFTPKPNVVIYIYDESEKFIEDQESTQFVLTQNKKRNKEIMKRCIYIALKTQAVRTKRHLMHKVSPMAQIEVEDV
jgi:hypothetical protein